MRALLPIATSLVLLAAAGCNKQSYKFDTKSPAHAGQGEVVLKVDKKTGNGTIELTVEHLAPPERIDGSMRAYVVWVASAGKDPHKLGVLEYKAKKRAGSLSATFSDDEMQIIVTLEKDPSVDTPTGVRVVEQDVIAPK
ncbi:hypothetical protein PPSIR1_13645 [Plesiocystis pacifica SIR-1]|uniref:Lipoprotein n=1 Tax=Plesiocystis pacifica SIR-1 TaxID=391625 RepID=A6GF29_9BACT|nr:anti-sigma factor [Plesiocystis pacifica]EDM75556.1 hypothetical protein PPSIR1_13645 [Plesiocystis pacifica SIR-1]